MFNITRYLRNNDVNASSIKSTDNDEIKFHNDINSMNFIILEFYTREDIRKIVKEKIFTMMSIKFLRTTHPIERESLAEFIANDEEYRPGILQLLENYRNKNINDNVKNLFRAIRIGKAKCEKNVSCMFHVTRLISLSFDAD